MVINDIKNGYLPPLQTVQIVSFLIDRDIPVDKDKILFEFDLYLDSRFKYMNGEDAKKLVECLKLVPQIDSQAAQKLLLPKVTVPKLKKSDIVL